VDLRDAFEWNMDVSSSFLNMNAKDIVDTLYGQMVEAAGDTPQAGVQRRTRLAVQGRARRLLP